LHIFIIITKSALSPTKTLFMHKLLLSALLMTATLLISATLHAAACPSDTPAAAACSSYIPTAAACSSDTSSPAAARVIPSSLNAPLTLRIAGDSLPRGNTNINLQWQLLVNGTLKQKGELRGLILPPRRPALVHLPLRLPRDNVEAFLRLEYHSAAANHPLLATEFLPLRSWGLDNSIPGAGELNFSDSGDVFTITSSMIRIRFDKETGWLQRFEAGDLLLADTAALTSIFRSRQTDHSRQSDHSPQPDHSGISAGPGSPWDSVQPHLQLFSSSTGNQLVIIKAEYTLPEVSCLLHMSYTINAAGDMLVEQAIEPDSSRQGPPLPRFGMSWVLPPGFDSVSWYGGPTSTPGQLRWWAITDHKGRGLRILADTNFLDVSSAPYADNDQLHSKSLSTKVNIFRSQTVHELPYGDYKYSYKATLIFPAAARESSPHPNKP
jgi:hypothetical protein